MRAGRWSACARKCCLPAQQTFVFQRLEGVGRGVGRGMKGGWKGVGRENEEWMRGGLEGNWRRVGRS